MTRTHRARSLVAAAALVAAGISLVTGCGVGIPGGSEPATWELREQPTATSTTLEVAVTRVECASGVTGEVLAPVVRYEPGRIVIETPVADNGIEAATCQGNDAVPITVSLSEPVGDRALVDGACLQDLDVDLVICGSPERWLPEN